MKKYYISAIIAAALNVTNVYAAGASLGFSGNTSFDGSTTVYLNVGGVSGLSGVCGFEGRLNYDASKIELTGASAGAGFSLTQGGKIVAYRSTCVTSGTIVALAFRNKALANNETTSVTFTEVGISDESQSVSSSNVSVSLKYVAPTKPDNNTNNNNNNGNKNNNKKDDKQDDKNDSKKDETNKNIEKSSDNSLKAIKLSVGSVDLKEGVLNYDVFVGKNVNTIEILAETNDAKSSVNGVGKYELKDDLTEVKLEVKAEDGSTRTYVIRILKDETIKAEPANNNNGNNLISWVVLSIGIVLAVLGGVFFILAKKRNNKKK